MIRPAPSSAIASAGGLKRGERKVSMQCESASIPVAAVRRGGRPSVRSGSHTARFGIRCGLMKPSLRPSARLMRAARPTSLPVPAVVGMAITGATRSVMRPSPPSIVAYCASGSGWVARIATALARSIGEPPPKPMTPVAGIIAVQRQRSVRGLFGRIGRDVVENEPRHPSWHHREQVLDEPRCYDAFVRYNERTSDTERIQILRDLGEYAATEPDGGEIGDQSHRLTISPAVQSARRYDPSPIATLGARAAELLLFADQHNAFEQTPGSKPS